MCGPFFLFVNFCYVYNLFMDMNLDKVFYISFNTNTIVHVACQKN